MGDIALSAADVSRIYAVGRTRDAEYHDVMTFWKSTNGGKDWSSLTIAEEPGCGQAVAIEPGNDTVIYAGGVRNSGKPILLKTENGGTSWTAIGEGTITGQVLEIAVHPQAPLRVLAGTTDGLFLSADGGATWGKVLNGEAREILFDPGPPFDVYAAGTTGVWRSRDLGVSWEAFSADLDYPSLLSMAVDWSQRVFYAGTAGNGVRRKKFGEPVFIYPPAGLKADAREVRSVLQREHIGDLAWLDDPRNADIAKYRVYLVTEAEKTLLGEVAAGTRRFLHRKISSGTMYSYSVTAVDRNGREGGGAFVTLYFK